MESGQIVGSSAEEEEEDRRAKKELAVPNRKPPQQTRATTEQTGVVLRESPEPEVLVPGIRVKIDDLIEQTNKKKVSFFDASEK